MKFHNRLVLPLFIISLLLFYSGCLDTSSNGTVQGGISEYPERTELGDPVTIRWWITYPPRMNISHAGVHYGYFSHPGSLGIDVGSKESGYTELVVIPAELLIRRNDFEVNFTTARKGVLYFRAHNIIDGRNYWSEENSIIVE